MQVSVESTSNLERRMNFSLPAEQLESGVSGRLREIARTAKMKGFRPGKVPAKVIEDLKRGMNDTASPGVGAS